MTASLSIQNDFKKNTVKWINSRSQEYIQYNSNLKFKNIEN